MSSSTAERLRAGATQVSIGFGAAAFVASCAVAGAAAVPRITLYAQPRFTGPSFRTTLPTYNLRTQGFAGNVKSVIVDAGAWQLCDRPSFGGRCITVRRGRYGTGVDRGFTRTVVSMRPVGAVTR